MRNFLTRRTALPVWALVLGGAVLLGLGGAAGSSSEDEPTPTTVEESTLGGTIASGPIATEAPVTVAPTTTTTEPPKTWQAVATLASSSSKRGAPFRISSPTSRLRYSSQAGVLYIYVLPVGHDLDTQGGSAETSCSQPCSDETFLAKSPGEYYLDVKSANGAWNITIEELR